MNFLFLLSRSIDETLDTIILEIQKEHHVTIIDLNSTEDYEQIINLVESSDRVISW